MVVATAAALALGASSASAHFCYVNNLTPNAAANMADSSAFVTFGELAFEFTGLCPAGIEILAEAGGVSVSTPINMRATMAHGQSNHGIGHLDFEAIDAAFLDAAAACM
ncbi:hypothetical protein [Ruania alba]|uniref:hypothetical protein n=1 Tax=Ruania alba TaxID=648782 RepID=UPI001587A7E4|nr:hypothetical protein [Ruania alba]